MLPLDDPGWSLLSHAYGAASDTPVLLRQLARSPGPTTDYRTEPWFTLWSSLCHQGDVYQASYAALPHVVQIAQDARGPIACDFFLLPASIEVARASGRGPELPPPLADAYRDGLRRLLDCIGTRRHEAWDRSMLLSVVAALCAAKGHPRIAEALVDLDDDWIAKIIDKTE